MYDPLTNEIEYYNIVITKRFISDDFLNAAVCISHYRGNSNGSTKVGTPTLWRSTLWLQLDKRAWLDWYPVEVKLEVLSFLCSSVISLVWVNYGSWSLIIYLSSSFHGHWDGGMIALRFMFGILDCVHVALTSSARYQRRKMVYQEPFIRS